MKLSHCRKLLQNGATLQTIIQPSANGSIVTIEPSIDGSMDGSSTADKQPSNYKSPASHFDSSMGLAIFGFLIALFFVAFLSMYIRRLSSVVGGEPTSVQARRRRTRYSISSSRSEASKGLGPSTVRSLPLVPYHGDAEQGISDCVICLSVFEERETVKMIPHCRHVFHPECIDTWLDSHVSCPLCRSVKMSA